ncbi:sugar phosphate isomerase/epimerase [Sporosarcina sp. ACRSM]|uniref:sugar phosphate isomerase/epimerase family protein n=1 Tax=Sporosarcina sp. ACRSM TaxID=2918216 RepID=UPI001EF71E90|nr:sugar phosphate isomerase/epimerase family protein [Sporosarcina sp. ACRSM]MCG7334725.1 sugar phosphate isomerase/epimerase [Sporosarcina sp. ACRSM]
MKLAYPFLTEETENPSLGFRGDPEEIFPLLKELGYDGIEPLVRNPNKIHTSSFEKFIHHFDLDVAAIGTGPVVSDDKLTFTAKDDSVRKEAQKRARGIVEFASLFGCPVNIGKLRGDIDGDQSEQSWQWLRQGIEQVCEHAEKYGIRIALEPQSKKVINNLNSTQQGLAFIREMDFENLFLMLDVYHMNLEDESIETSFREANGSFIYIHMADSNRQAPGKGNLNFQKIIQLLNELNYQGFMTPEIMQAPDSYREAKAAIDHLRLCGL